MERQDDDEDLKDRLHGAAHYYVAKLCEHERAPQNSHAPTCPSPPRFHARLLSLRLRRKSEKFINIFLFYVDFN